MQPNLTKYWLTESIQCAGEDWRIIMRNTYFYRKHLTLDHDWKPDALLTNKHQKIALTWAQLATVQRTDYERVLAQVRIKRDEYHERLTYDVSEKRRQYMREYIKNYRMKERAKRTKARLLNEPT